MLRLVLRPLLVVLTLGMLVVGLFQVVGRVTFALLDDLELGVNQVLSAQGIRLTGLEGDWRMLNPIVRAQRIDLPAGHVEGFVVEVDMVASVLQGTLLARRLKIDTLWLQLDKPRGEPWRMAGTAGGGGVDLAAFLSQSEQLELDGVVAFDREGMPPAEVGFSYIGINRGGGHRHALELRNQPEECIERCLLRVDFHGQDRLWPLRPGQARVTATGSGFQLPKALLGLSPLRIAELELAWQRSPTASGGTAALRAEQFDMPGDVKLATRLEVSVAGHQGVHEGAVTGWEMQRGDDVWELPDVAVSATAEGLSLWMPELDLERAANFLRQALAGIEPAQRWLDGLNVRGRAHNLRAFYRVEGGGLGYALTLDGLALDGFKGVPEVSGARGELFGYRHGLQLNLNAHDMAIAFPDIFNDRWQFAYAQGVVQAWFGRDYFGIRGLNIRAETDGIRAAGGFAISRPPDRPGQRLLLLANADEMGVAQAKRFVPYKLPEGLRGWIDAAPRGGTLDHLRLAYQAQFQVNPGELGRRLELAAGVRDGKVRYHPDWPEVTDLGGHLAVAGSTVAMDVDTARSAGAILTRSRVTLVDKAASVDVSLDADIEAADALALVRTTPLIGWLGFIEPDWRSNGPMRLSGELHVPLAGPSVDAAARGAPAEDTLGVRLRADLEGVNLALPGYRITVEELQGSLRYRYPSELDAAGVRGRLFGAAVALGAASDEERIYLTVSGQARPVDLWGLMDIADPGLATGTFDYEAGLAIALAPQQVSELRVTSTLDGLGLTLPGPYGKPTYGAQPIAVRLEFLPDYRVVNFEYRDARGWVHFDDRLLRGSVGFDARPATVDDSSDELVLEGHLTGFALDEVLPTPGSGMALPLPVRLNQLQVDHIGVGDFGLSQAILNGEVNATGFQLDVRATELTGSLTLAGDGPMEVVLEEFNVPVGENPGDPLKPSVIGELPSATVRVDRLMLGEQNYGSWRFQLHPEADVLYLRELEARVRGVEIASKSGLVWRGSSNETSFDGTLRAENLADVLPLWGYAPNVETRSASLQGNVVWTGSPVAVDLLALRGEAEVAAEEGRFVDVESGAGALRIVSLLNFTAIAKRMSLNFADVFGRGVSFDSLSAKIAFDQGTLSFLDAMEVEGTGSSFRVTGSVDLKAGRLNNEMIVTLPVTRSLPWYAAYVALANPLAGLGVLLGERVLRKPLEQFSSARYRIGGTLESPEVQFVSVFDVTTPPPERAADSVAAPQPEANPPAPEQSAPAQPQGPDAPYKTEDQP